MITTSRFGPEAAELFSQIHARCFDPPWSEADFARLLASSGVAGLIGGLDGIPSGLALIRTVAGECEILTIGVADGARRAGLGAALLAAAEDAARTAGARRLFLEVSTANAPAAALYASAGYAEAGRRTAYYRDRSDARVLAKPLI